MTLSKLFAVYLGGRAPKANTELHDLVFVTGARVEDTYVQLLDKWFGDSKSLHIDRWLELDMLDGWRVTLSDTQSPATGKLFFVNLGAYRDGEFTELHAMGFYVAPSALGAKKRALTELFSDRIQQKHKCDLHTIDDCIPVDAINGLHVTLTKTGETSDAKPNNGYYIIPKEVVAAHLAR